MFEGNIFSRIRTSQPIRLLSRRNLMNPGFKKMKLERTEYTTYDKPSFHSSASIKNGTIGETIFPRGTFWKTFRQEIPKAVGAFFSVTTLIVGWPLAVVAVNNFVRSVPYNSNTSAVRISKFGTVEDVTIPNTYVHLEKRGSDE